MTRKKTEAEKYEERPAAFLESNFDSAFEAITEEAKKEFPGNVYSGGEEEMRCICLPVPAFAIRFLIQQEGWPMSRFNMFVGPQESFKSALAVEVGRWHRLQHGNVVKIDTEFKPAPELHISLLNYDFKAMKSQKCARLEEWHKALEFWVEQAQRRMDGYRDGDRRVPGVGRSFPVCFIVDSLVAVLDEKLYARMDKEGTASKHFSIQAAFNTDYLKFLPTKLDDYPFTFIGVNHLKERQDEMGNTFRSIPGGKSLLYHETLELELKRGPKVDRVDEKGVTVKISVTKNSMGPHEKIEVDVIWYMDIDNKDPRTGACRQVSFFDWHTASIDILYTLMGGGTGFVNRLGTRQARLIKELTELHCNLEKRTAWSPVLGIPEKKPVSWREAGYILEQKLQTDEAFRKELYPLCGIRRRTMFKPGIDFREQQEAARQAALALQADQETSLPFPISNQEVS